MSDEQASRLDDQEQVQRLSLALLQAVNTSTVAGVRDVWALDGTLMPPHHPAVSGRDAITQYFIALFNRGRFAFKFTHSSIDLNGHVAIEHVQYTATFFPAGGGAPRNDKGKGLHVFRRQPAEGWQLEMDIWNTDDPRP
ncbi:MAG: YybH family protein [Acidimicrobiia bacterium]